MAEKSAVYLYSSSSSAASEEDEGGEEESKERVPIILKVPTAAAHIAVRNQKHKYGETVRLFVINELDGDIPSFLWLYKNVFYSPAMKMKYRDLNYSEKECICRGLEHPIEGKPKPKTRDNIGI